MLILPNPLRITALHTPLSKPQIPILAIFTALTFPFRTPSRPCGNIPILRDACSHDNTHVKKVVKEDAGRKGYPHSYIEKLWDSMYLEGRWSLPVNSNPYLGLTPPPKHAAVPAGSDPQIVGATRYVARTARYDKPVLSSGMPCTCVWVAYFGFCLGCSSISRPRVM